MAGDKSPEGNGDLSERKQHHLDLCLDPEAPVESGDTGFEGIRLPHRALPEIDADAVDIRQDLIGYRLAAPLIISSMTGGSDEGRRLNRLLARAAEELGIAIGTGSIRVMFRDPTTKDHFTLKKEAPDVPVLANLGAVQVRDYPVDTVVEAVKSLEADGLYVHLNAGQELFQKEGDRDFRGLYEGIRRLCDAAPFPVLVKETGAGIAPADGLRLLKAGVDFVDIAGVGGTDWIAVEVLRRDISDRTAGEAFRGWGYPTADLLLAYRALGRRAEGKIIASGGLRTPRDVAVSLAAGAVAAGMALPFIRAAAEKGLDGALAFGEAVKTGLISALALTGCPDLSAFRHLPLRVDTERAASAREILAEVDDGAVTTIRGPVGFASGVEGIGSDD